MELALNVRMVKSKMLAAIGFSVILLEAQAMVTLD